MTQEGLADILGLLDYVHNSGDHPDSAYMHIDWIEAVGCKREGRRFVGQYVSSQNDVMTCRNGSIADPHGMCVYNDKSHLPQEPFLPFDRVAYAGWSFDLHNPKGMRDHATMGQAAGTAGRAPRDPRLLSAINQLQGNTRVPALLKNCLRRRGHVCTHSRPCGTRHAAARTRAWMGKRRGGGWLGAVCSHIVPVWRWQLRGGAPAPAPP